ncbi:hypothetical protein E1J77_14230 [Salmonella enterica subsp. enterica serovar Typhimurium]|nr:hypothetical protein [Salmonella enterica subsp. enterica serovar Typhimurium]
MSDIKRYEITWNQCSMHGKFIVEINPHDCYFSQLMSLYKFCNTTKEQFSLWGEEDFKFDLVTITLKVLAEKSLKLIISNDWNLRELLRYFEDNGHNLHCNSGIEIIEVPHILLHSYCMQVNEIQPCAAN